VKQDQNMTPDPGAGPKKSDIPGSGTSGYAEAQPGQNPAGRAENPDVSAPGGEKGTEDESSGPPSGEIWEQQADSAGGLMSPVPGPDTK
jgi:hypothetical protein